MKLVILVDIKNEIVHVIQEDVRKNEVRIFMSIYMRCSKIIWHCAIRDGPNSNDQTSWVIAHLISYVYMFRHLIAPDHWRSSNVRKLERNYQIKMFVDNYPA